MNKSERLLNLLILLLVQRHYISKDRIRATVDVYRDATDEAFERMFERDKDELRALGVPIELGNVDPLFDDETGYRIRPDEFALPGIELSADAGLQLPSLRQFCLHRPEEQLPAGRLVEQLLHTAFFL